MYWPRRRRKTKSCTPYSHGSAPPLSGSTTSPYNICPQGPHRLLACISAAGRTTPRFGAHTKRRSHKQDFQNINAWEVHHRVSRKSSQLTCWIRPSTNPSPPAVHQNGQPSLRSSPAHHRPQPRRLHALAAESASRLGTSRKQPSPRGGDDVGTYTLDSKVHLAVSRNSTSTARATTLASTRDPPSTGRDPPTQGANHSTGSPPLTHTNTGPKIQIRRRGFRSELLRNTDVPRDRA